MGCLVSSSSSGSLWSISIPSSGTVRAASTSKVLFEYGAETGVLQPPWDLVRQFPEYGATITIVDRIARTGSKSVKFEHTAEPPKESEAKRTSLRKWETWPEFYLSWWVYFPSDFDCGGQDPDRWDTLGGVKYMWDDDAEEWKFRFMVTKYDGKHEMEFVIAGTTYPLQSKYYRFPDHRKIPKETWIHLQMYIYLHETDGVIRAWATWSGDPGDGGLLVERTGIPTLPSDSDAPDTPYITISHYTSNYDPPAKIYVDDVVASSEKVPENYGVTGA